MNKIKVSLFIIISLLIIAVASFVSWKLIDKSNKKDEQTTTTVVKKNAYNIDYSSNDSILFKELIEELNSKEVTNDSEYASLIAKIFIVDLYSLKSKTNKYDVGGIEVVYPNIRDNYTLNVTNTLYKYIEDNENNNRVQALPMVKEISVDKVEETTYTINEVKYSAYKIDLIWDYDSINEYDKTGEIIVIDYDGFMYVVEKN